MADPDRPTILEELVKRLPSINFLVEARKEAHFRFISDLILSSTEIQNRWRLPWEYKSLAHYAEEQFVVFGIAGSFFKANDTFDMHWHQTAAKDFTARLCENIWSEDDEGIILFVKEEERFRRARAGDAAYDFARRLKQDDSLSGLWLNKPPSWAYELFLSQANLEAYGLFWHDNSYLSDPKYKARMRARAEAVVRETERLMGEREAAEIPIEPGAGIDSKLLGARERSTLLTIIGALAKEAKVDISKPSKAATFIEGLTNELGAPVSKRSIEEHLKTVSAAVASRSK